MKQFVMKKTIYAAVITAITLLLARNGLAATYYVATGGSDTNSGTTLDSPFRSLQQAGNIMVAGDTCLIRGGTYYETLAPLNSGTADSPITFMPYNAETVTVSAANAVTGWSVYSNNIYRADMTWDLGDGFNQLFVNGAMVNEARWPNTGTNLLSPTLASGTAAADSISLTVTRPANYWVGGTVYGLFGSKWTSQGGTITSSTSNGVLTVTNKTSNWYTGAGNAYITGIFSELDSAGEWFLSGTSLYLWAPGSVNPATLLVETKRRKWCVNLSGKAYINVMNLNLFAGSIRMDTSNCNVSGCNVKYLSHFTRYTWGGMDAAGDCDNGNNGVWINGTGNVISNSTFQYSAGSGILIYGASNTFTRCVISEIDYSATYSCPLSIKGSTGGNRVLFNSMYNTGRDVLQLYGATADIIMYNNLYNAGKLCRDLGITYQWGRDGQGTRLAYNWIHDNLAPSSNPGIYNDNYCRNFIDDHNVIWNCEAGVRINGPADAIQVYNNTLFNCDDVGTHTYNEWPDYTPSYWTTGGYGNSYNYSANNNLFLGTNPGSQLTDYANSDFTLKIGAAAINAGSVVAPYTDGYQGAAPDQGAYEDGLSRWTAGYNGIASVPPTMPSVRTDPATSVTAGSATLNGSLTSTGAASTVVRVFWGVNDALTVTTNWDHSIAFGTNSAPVPVAYSTNITGLIPATTYYYRYYAVNAYTASWGAVQSFTPFLPFSTQTVTFAATTDLDIQPNGTKTTNATTLIAGNNQSVAGTDRRIFIAFDLSGLAANWSVQSATLRLYHVTGANNTYGSAALYPVTNAWNLNSVIYSQPVGASLGSVVGSGGPFNVYESNDVTTLIRQYQANTNSLYGFSVRGTEGFGTTAKYFVSSEGSAGQRPELVVAYSIPDSNSNNVPDAWEWTWFTNLTTVTTDSDWDHDGVSDRDEYIAGTSPVDPLDYLAIQSVSRSLMSTGMVVSWRGVVGRLYTVVIATNLYNNFYTVSNFVDIEGSGGWMMYTNSATLDRTQFFRIRVRML